ncbi:hypothetical protein PsorP6_003676 [Peronosclerospora sorghi]|uniref:Uncharacterized protein n=1 Tax=Peronosclerospora sorghi TaxID=230839 RepID=A0ACC0VLE4_9STRA|nr:hypothetical protein PsorP6_003676 [Peronosclerospora sorghi]
MSPVDKAALLILRDEHDPLRRVELKEVHVHVHVEHVTPVCFFALQLQWQQQSSSLVRKLLLLVA